MPEGVRATDDGRSETARDVLKRHVNCIRQNVASQLAQIVTKNETHHPVLQRFSYSRLLMTVESYVDAYLESNPSDYLLKVQKPSQRYT